MNSYSIKTFPLQLIISEYCLILFFHLFEQFDIECTLKSKWDSLYMLFHIKSDHRFQRLLTFEINIEI